MVGTDRTAIVTPSIAVGVIGLPMLPIYSQYLVRCVVDTHLQLPDMFELFFNDENGDIVESAGLSIGTQVEVKAGAATSMTAESLIVGEITSIEAICQEAVILTVVRGYAKEHRLQRAQRTRTFVNMSDSDIARKVAGDAGLTIGTIDSTSGVHEHLAQVAQSDWDFLSQRAREIGYETGVTAGEFYFRKASTGAAGGGGLLDAAASMLGLGGTLKFKDNLHVFLPRLSAANITPDVEVRVWDGMTGKVAVGTAPAASGTATIDGQDPGALANSFTDGLLPMPPMPPSPPALPGMPSISLGTNPSNTAYVVVNRPLATGQNATRAAEEAAKSLADHVASTFAEAEGDCEGDPTIQAGSTVTIEGVPKQFAGKWVVSNAKHIFDPMEGGYHIRFYVSGRQDRSTLSLTSGKSARDSGHGFGGMVCGVVTGAQDPEKLGRVKVAMPWLSPQYESDWARVVQVGAGARSGMLFVPSVGDEVLMGFEFGDPRRPYVLGGLINTNSDFGHLSTAVDGSGKVIERGLATPAGSRLLFTDDLSGPPGSAPPTKAEIVLGSKDDKIGLKIDQANGTVSLTCDPAPPNSSTANGSLTIECPGLGAITIKAGAGGLKLETDGELSLSGKQGVKIESVANTVIKGLQVQLN